MLGHLHTKENEKSWLTTKYSSIVQHSCHCCLILPATDFTVSECPKDNDVMTPEVHIVCQTKSENERGVLEA